MITKQDTNKARLQRHKRVRAKISGTSERPRLCVYRSNANISAQIIDDVNGVTLVSATPPRRISPHTAETKRLHVRSERRLPREQQQRELKQLYLTEAAICTTDVYRSSQKVPVRADLSSKEDRLNGKQENRCVHLRS